MIDARNHGAGIRKLESRLKLLEEGKEASRRAKALENEADSLRNSVRRAFAENRPEVAWWSGRSRVLGEVLTLFGDG